jgi:hypothetical protein
MSITEAALRRDLARAPLDVLAAADGTAQLLRRTAAAKRSRDLGKG